MKNFKLNCSMIAALSLLDHCIAFGGERWANCPVAIREMSSNAGEPEISAVARFCHPGTIITLTTNGSSGPTQVARLCDFSKAVVTLGSRTICVTGAKGLRISEPENPLTAAIKSLASRVKERNAQQEQESKTAELKSSAESSIAERIKADVLNYFRKDIKKPLNASQQGRVLTFTNEFGRAIRIVCLLSNGERRYSIRYDDLAGSLRTKFAVDDDEMLDIILEWSAVS